MGSFTVWHWVILLVLGGLMYAVYLTVRAKRQKRTKSSAFAVGAPSLESIADRQYEIVAEELRSNSLRQAIWIRAFAEADGDEAKAQAAYIRYRVAELQTDRSSEAASPNPGPPGTPSKPVRPWKKTAAGVGILLTWMLVITGIGGFLLVALGGDFGNPQDRRLGGQAGFYALVGIGILSAIYARRRKPMWFLIGSLGACIGLLAASIVVSIIRNAFP